jgi:beta-lactamase class A
VTAYDTCNPGVGLVEQLQSLPGVRLAVRGPGCSYGYRDDERLCAASTIKLLALAVTIEQLQAAGEVPDGELLDDLTRMIQWSDNEATTRTLDRYEQRGANFPDAARTWGIDAARHPRWGTAPVTAAQMADLVTQMFFSERLSEGNRLLALELLDLPSRDWDTGWRVGVGYGAPPDWYHGSKIGLLYCGGSLALHGVGLLCAPRQTACWAVALLSDGWDSEQRGLEELNRVGGLVSDMLVAQYAAGVTG